MQKYICSQKPAVKIIICILVFTSFFTGCKKDGVKTDLVTLRKLCNVPDEVVSCRWQVKEFGNDWNLIAELDFDINKPDAVDNYLTKPKLHKRTFIYNSPLPKWVVDLNIFVTDSTGRSEYIGTEKFLYEPDQFAEGVLMNGFAVKVSETKILLYLFTM